MQSTWKQALAWVREDEGGNDDDPSDHGGRTSRGITQREYDQWRHAQGLSVRDVWKASDPEIDTIYHDKYWLPYSDTLPAGVDYQFFDMNVNSGEHAAALMLQRTLGVNADGQIGPLTLAAVAKASPNSLVLDFTARHEAFFRAIAQHPGQLKFLHGWLNRAAHVEKRALQLIKESA